VSVPSEPIDNDDDDDDNNNKFRKQPYWALNTSCGSANVEEQNMFNMRNNITCSIKCKYRAAATVCTLETWFVSGM